MRYLLDTNVLSEPVKASPDDGVMDGLRVHRADVVTAAPVWHELTFGCYRLPPSARRRVLERYLHVVLEPQLIVLPYDAAAGRWHAAERARLAAAGRTPPFVDGQIAAVAAVHDLTLVTANTDDYADFQGLRVEDWRVEP